MDSEDKDFPLSKLLQGDSGSKLYILMKSPGWKDLIRVVDHVRLDWAEQIMSRNYTGNDNQTIIQDLIRKQGQMEGLARFFGALEVWKKSRDKDLTEGKE